MEISSIPEAFQTSLRIAILSALISGTKTFKDLKQITGATDGNLGAQLRKLEEFEYITVNKNFVKRKPQSSYTITKYGLKQFKDYVNFLGSLLQNYDDEK